MVAGEPSIKIITNLKKSPLEEVVNVTQSPHFGEESYFYIHLGPVFVMAANLNHVSWVSLFHRSEGREDISTMLVKANE